MMGKRGETFRHFDLYTTLTWPLLSYKLQQPIVHLIKRLCKDCLNADCAVILCADQSIINRLM